MNNLILGLTALLVLINVFVTAALLKSALYEKHQRQLQVIFIWLVPFAAALLAWSLMHATRAQRTLPAIPTTQEPLGPRIATTVAMVDAAAMAAGIKTTQSRIASTFLQAGKTHTRL